MTRTLATLLTSAALVLAGCGSATVEDTGENDPIAPLERSSSASAAPESGATESETRESAASTSASAPEDRGAHEIAEIPEPVGPQGAEQQYLAALAQGGVDVAGIEDTLIAAAQAVCQEDVVTVPAVAGQLIEQGRTQLDHGQLTALITEQARGNVCAN